MRETFMVTWKTVGFPAGQQGSLPPGWLRGRAWQSLVFHSFRISLSGALVFLWWRTSKHLPWWLPQKLQQVSGLSQVDTDMTSSSLCQEVTPGMPIFGNDTAASTHAWSWWTTASMECLTGEGNVLEAHVMRTQFSQICFKHLCVHGHTPLHLYSLLRKRGRGVKDFDPTPTAVLDAET